MTDCTGEFPDDWFETAKLSPDRSDPKLNYFGVRASKPLSYWRAKVHAVGFSGIVAIIGGVAVSMIYVRSSGGRPCAGILRSYKSTARKPTRPAAPGNGKPCCTGPTIRGCCS